jgi:hypothetical protein
MPSFLYSRLEQEIRKVWSSGFNLLPNANKLVLIFSPNHESMLSLVIFHTGPLVAKWERLKNEWGIIASFKRLELLPPMRLQTMFI